MYQRHLTNTPTTLAEVVQSHESSATGVNASFGHLHFIAIRRVRASKGPWTTFQPTQRLCEPSTPDSTLRGHDRVSVDLPSAAHAPLQRLPRTDPHPAGGSGAARAGRGLGASARARSLPSARGRAREVAHPDFLRVHYSGSQRSRPRHPPDPACLPRLSKVLVLYIFSIGKPSS